MSDTPETGSVFPSPSAAGPIDAVADRFEAAWKAGERPQIEQFLTAAPEPTRPTLLCELVALDIAYRLRDGEHPLAEDYRKRFPSLDPTWLAQLIADQRG